ncbi:MAG TPA: TonB-dependent receptor, partial [Chitinophagales bacterium]|nr:TonB-dependent receptor [Chitinophagales bacterium]
MRAFATHLAYNLLLLVLVPAALCAQDITETVRGKVIDKDSRQPLFGVNVMVMSTNPPQGAVTDENGEFKIEQVKVGRHTLRFSLVGYDEAMVSEVLVSSGKELYLNIEMQEKVTNMNEVVVTSRKDKSKANNEFATISARSFSAEEMSRYAATQNDPARVVQSFAGVMTAGDDNNQIVVRGNSPRGLLWRMEGIEIPNPNHFAGSEGSTGGGVSILSANMLTNTDFYSGAFPAEYGDALSGVFDLNLRKGNTDKHEFAFQAGVLGLEAALEGPFSKKYNGSYLINYRYSTLEILSLMGLKIGGDVLPKYQDLSFNFYFPTKKMGTFTLFGIGGMSSLGQDAVHDTTKWHNISDKSEYSLNQMVGVVGLTHLYLFKNNKTYLRSVVSYSYTNNQSTDDTLSDEFNKFTLDDEKFIYKTFRATMMINHKLDAKNLLRAGVIYSNIDFKLLSEAYSYLAQQTQTQVNNTGNTSMLQAYVEWKHRFSEIFQLNSGVHFTYSFVNGKFYAEPRLGGEWQITEAQTFSFGFGLHSRIDAMSTYFSYVDTTPGQSRYPNKTLDFSRALHAVVGYNFNFKKDFRLKLEAYAQYLFNVPIGSDSADATFSMLNYNDGFVNIPLKSTGTGYNYGLEITLEKFFSHHYFFMYTASLYQSKYKAADGVWRSTAYDVHYVMNLLGGKEFVLGKKQNNILGFNIKLIWRGGQRYTPVDLPASILANETVYNNNAAFSQKLPDYFRIDFGTYIRRNLKHYSWTFSFDAQNIINRQNVA